MYKKTIALLLATTGFSLALDAATVFANQKKAAFPDTAEIRMRTTLTLPGMAVQQVETKVLSKGKDKSVAEIKSSAMNMKIVRNGDQMGMLDLKTGKAMPSQTLPKDQLAALDVSQGMGSAEDYQAPVAVDSLWKLVPKEPSRPTLFYSEKTQRVVKMQQTPSLGVYAETLIRYCTSGCALPGTPTGIEIVSSANGIDTKVVLEVVLAKKRTALSDALFTIPK